MTALSDYYDPALRDPSRSRRPLDRRGDEWIQALLARVKVCRIASCWGDFPFINPTSFVYRPQTHDIVYHSNIAGRIRANAEHDSRVTFEASEVGAFLPSNDPLELSVQYRSVIAYGQTRILDDPQEAEQALETLSARYFPALRFGQELRPLHEGQLARTSVYALSVERWSGKENWPDVAPQAEDWPPLPSPQER